jgi:hypothetical protein
VHLTLVDPGFSLRPLRISATSALKFVNGENAEIRRDTQRAAEKSSRSGRTNAFRVSLLKIRMETERKHIAFQRNMYNRLLFDCLQVAVDVIFAAVSNQCPQETVVRETLPTFNVAVERLVEVTKRGVF